MTAADARTGPDGAFDPSSGNLLRTGLGLTGLVTVAIGVAVLVWPEKTAAIVAAIVSVYAVLAGLANLAIGVFSRTLRGWSRLGYLALGAAFLIAAATALANLGTATNILGVLVAILVGSLWVGEGVVSLTMLRNAPSKVLTILFAVLSITAGFAVAISPMWGAGVLWWLLGISLTILGVVQLVRAFRYTAG